MKGWNQTRIANHFGVTRQAVSDMKRKYGNYSKTPREVVLEEFPWKVRSDQQNCNIDHRMRDHGEYMATGGKGMAPIKLKRLIGFYNKL